MNPVARRRLVDRVDDDLFIVVQCRLLKIARSTLYWRPAAMRRIDEAYPADVTRTILFIQTFCAVWRWRLC
jgi:hypothetical protein